jgi:hypothetical protein
MTNRPLIPCLVIVSAFAAAPAPSADHLGAVQSPVQLLASARAAIGGEAKLASVKTVKLSGDGEALNEAFGRHPDATQQYTKKRIDVQALWPDHYVRTRITVFPDGRTGPPFRSGIAGTVSVGGTMAANIERLDFARWMLLFLLRTDTVVPLTLRPNLNQHGELQFNGPHNLECSIALDAVTRAPVSLRMPVKRPQSDGFPSSETIREIVISVVSRRSIDGIKVPEHLVIKDAAQKILEQYRFGTIEINPPLTSADFRH